MSENDALRQSRRKMLGMVGAGAATSLFGSGVARGISSEERTTTTITQVTPFFEADNSQSNETELVVTKRDDLRGISVFPEDSIVHVYDYAAEVEREALLENETVAMTPHSTDRFKGQILNSGSSNELPVRVNSSGGATDLIKSQTSVHHPAVIGRTASATEASIACNGEVRTVELGEETKFDFFSDVVPATAQRRKKTSEDSFSTNDTKSNVSVNGGIVVRHLGEVEVQIE